jgi:protein phosphatase methylesterase 1
MSSLEKDLLQRQFIRSTPRPLQTRSRIAFNSRFKKDYSPLHYKQYFDESRDLKTANGESFRVYVSGFNNQSPDIPLLLLLHGGGYSGLTWSLFTKYLTNLCLCKVAAIDLRGHGCTLTCNDHDLSIDTLCHDIGNVFKGKFILL